jgi:hypothetical protein
MLSRDLYKYLYFLYQNHETGYQPCSEIRIAMYYCPLFANDATTETGYKSLRRAVCLSVCLTRYSESKSIVSSSNSNILIS